MLIFALLWLVDGSEPVCTGYYSPCPEQTESCCNVTNWCCGFGCEAQSEVMAMGPYPPDQQAEEEDGNSQAEEEYVENRYACQTLATTGILYRSLNNNDRASRACTTNGPGLTARWTPENEVRTERSHVNCGSRQNYKGDWYISFTTNYDVANIKYNPYGQMTAVVYATNIPTTCQVLDFNEPEDAALLNRMVSQRFAIADCEVLIRCDWTSGTTVPCNFGSIQDDSKKDGSGNVVTWVAVPIGVTAVAVAGAVAVKFQRNRKIKKATEIINKSGNL